MNEHPLYYFIVAGSFFLLTGSALLALRWALRTGQLRDSKKSALIIFDDAEPVGEMTDHFPGTVTARTPSPETPAVRKNK